MITPPLIRLYAIVDRGLVLPITEAQRDRLVRLKMIYQLPNDEAMDNGWYVIHENTTFADIDFVL